MSLEGEMIFRPYNHEDLNQILSSWGSSFYKGKKSHRLLSPDDFHSFHRPIRDRFFLKPNTTVIVCCPEIDPWLVAGWIALEILASSKLVLHYIYVKEGFRNEGIASELMKRAIGSSSVVMSHLTDRGVKILDKNKEKYEGFHYIPHLV